MMVFAGGAAPMLRGLQCTPASMIHSTASFSVRSRLQQAAAAGDVEESTRNWRVAVVEAQAYEEQLQEILRSGERMIRELDSKFPTDITYNASYYGDIPKPIQPKDAWDTAPLFEFPEQELLFPDTDETPPILAGPGALGEPLANNFSGSLTLPARLYSAQIMAGVGDDPAAPEKENALWRETLQLMAGSLDSLYARAEDAVAVVIAAEARAERRRAASIGGFRDRVVQQMLFSKDFFVKKEQCSEWLTILQTDKRLLKWLALLERSSLQAEKLQAEIDYWKAEIEKIPEEDRGRSRAGDKLQDAFQKTRNLDRRIESCCNAATDVETLDAYDKLGEALDKVNPFKLFR